MVEKKKLPPNKNFVFTKFSHSCFLDFFGANFCTYTSYACRFHKKKWQEYLRKNLQILDQFSSLQIVVSQYVYFSLVRQLELPPNYRTFFGLLCFVFIYLCNSLWLRCANYCLLVGTFIPKSQCK